MRRRGSAAAQPEAAVWQLGRAAGLAASLLLLERGLTGAAGTPTEELRVLGQLVQAPADPVAPVIAVLALMAEVLAGYLLALLVLRSLSLLPGPLGRLTGRALLLASPRMLHRLLDVLAGGAMLAQATLVTMQGVRRVVSRLPCTTRRRLLPRHAAGPPSWAAGAVRRTRGPALAGRRRHCRPGSKAGRPTRRPGIRSRRATPCGRSPRPASRPPNDRCHG